MSYRNHNLKYMFLDNPFMGLSFLHFIITLNYAFDGSITNGRMERPSYIQGVQNKNRVLENFTLEDIMVRSILDCSKYCLRNAACLSINFEKANANFAKTTCQMNTRKASELEVGHFIAKDGFRYYEKVFVEGSNGNCGPPPIVSHSTVDVQTNSSGKYVTYRCIDDYTLFGDRDLYCQTNGEWPSPPVCLDGCSTPPAVSFSSVTLLQNVSGSFAVYSCDYSYDMVGPSEVKCVNTSHEIWTTPPTCVPNCGVAPTITNGVSTSPQLNTTMSQPLYQSNFSCSGSYILVGPSQVFWLTNLAWEETPSCIPDCGSEPLLSDGTSNTVQNTSGTFVTYSCNNYYILYGKATISCISPNNWEEIPTCALDCEFPPSVQMESVVNLTKNSSGTFAEYTCQNNYTSLGDIIIACLFKTAVGETWDVAPYCIAECGSVVPIDNGYILSTSLNQDNPQPKWQVSYGCDADYIRIGDGDVYCQMNLTWSGLPTCIPDCGSPTSVTDSTYNLNQDKNGTVATYSCDSGYTMIGSASVSCLSPGNWASLPVCIADCSTDPISISNGACTIQQNRSGQYSNCTCSTHYLMAGSQVIQCTSSNNWGSYGFCYLDCGNPPTVLSTASSTQIRSSSETSVSYSCASGYVIQGSSKLTCAIVGDTAQWDSSAPYCIANCTSPAPIVANSNNTTGIDLISEGLKRNYVSYTCNDGYTMSGSAKVYCTAGIWTVAPTCNARNIPMPNFSSETLVRSSLSTYGAWMKDSGGVNDDIYLTEESHEPKTFKVFEDLDSFVAGTEKATVTLGTTCDGTGHVVYNGYLYCQVHDHDYAYMQKVQLSDGAQVANVLITGAAVHGAKTYKNDIDKSDTDFAADSRGLYVTYVIPANSDNIVISKIDVNLNILSSWTTSCTKGDLGGSFMIDGVFYGTFENDGTDTTYISCAYDTVTGQSATYGNVAQSASVPNYESSGEPTYMSDYNPIDSKFYLYKDGKAITYTVSV